MRSMVEGARVRALRVWRTPSTIALRATVPLPVPGRIYA